MSGRHAVELAGRAGAETSRASGAMPAKGLLFDISNIDLNRRLLSRSQLEQWNPHRGQMALLDWIVWQSDDMQEVVGLKCIGGDEFWVSGHFPERPMFPGVLMLEAGAQVAAYAFNARFPKPNLAAFARVEQASFRLPVVPGDDLFILCKQVKFQPRRFITDLQGIVRGQAVFEARITGIALTDA